MLWFFFFSPDNLHLGHVINMNMSYVIFERITHRNGTFLIAEAIGEPSASLATPTRISSTPRAPSASLSTIPRPVGIPKLPNSDPGVALDGIRPPAAEPGAPLDWIPRPI